VYISTCYDEKKPQGLPWGKSHFDGEYEQLYVVQGDATGIKATPFKPNASPVSIKPDTGKK